jgi:hypothetical protein
MTVQNLQESCGSKTAERARALFTSVDPAHCGPSYTDGRLAPHEWVRLNDGQIVKTDHCGHVADHMLIGRQSWLWDVAGFLVEWGLNPSSRRLFLAQLRTCRSIDVRALRCHELAYTVFRLGVYTFCQSLEQDLAEAKRLEAARGSLRAAVSNLLECDSGGD